MSITLRRQGGGNSNTMSAEAPASLMYGEPAVDSEGCLYVGDGSGAVASKVNESRNGYWMYETVLLLDGWTETGEGTRQYTQTVVCKKRNRLAQEPTEKLRLFCPMCAHGANQTENDNLQDLLNAVNKGSAVVTNDGTVTITIPEIAKCNITIYWLGVNIDGTASMMMAGGGGMPKTGGTFTGRVNFANTENYYIDEEGIACFKKVYNAIYNDYAEWFPRGEETEPGDLIALDGRCEYERYVRASTENPCVVGVHSDEYAHIIGGEYYEDTERYFTENMKKYIPVGLAGRCRVKVKDDVKPGDMIVPSDIPGVGEKYDSKKNTMDMVLGRVVALGERKDEIRFAKVLLR